jgi:uncharacterized GH25 family protein
MAPSTLRSWQLSRIAAAVATIVVCGALPTIGWAADAPVAATLAARGVPAVPPSKAYPAFEETVAALEHFTVAGKFVTADGKLLADAEVVVYYSSQKGLRDRVTGRGKTDAEGAFRIDKAVVWDPVKPAALGLQTPAYVVVARQSSEKAGFTILRPEDSTQGLMIEAEAMKSYPIAVADAEGKPVAGALVYLVRSDHQQEVAAKVKDYQQYMQLFRDIGLFTGKTDAQGKVTISGPGRIAQFGAMKEGYAAGYGDDKIALDPGAKVKGKVLYDDGTPAAGAAVRYTYTSERGMDEAYTMADAEGAYEFAGAAALSHAATSMESRPQPVLLGSSSISAIDLRVGSPLLARRVMFSAKPGETITRDVVLRRACTLSGTVVHATTGKPLAGIEIWCTVRASGQSNYDRQPLKTDEAGKFQVTVPVRTVVGMQYQESRDGTYLIDQEWMNRNPFGRQPLREQTVQSDVTNLVFKLKTEEVQALTGKVVDEVGKPVAGAKVFYSYRVPAVQTDAAGLFTIKSAPKGKAFEVCALSADNALGALVPVANGADKLSIVLKPTADHDGLVTTPAGLPAGNLKFTMDAVVGNEPMIQLRQELTTDAQGRFRATHLIPGASYTASWNAENEQNRDYDYGNARIDLASVKPGETLQFTAKQYLNALMGKVVDPDDKPVVGAKIDVGASDLVPQDLRYNRAKPITTDKNGEFTIERLADGELAMTITAKGLKPGVFRSRTDAVDFVAKMHAQSEPVTMRAMVVDEQGKPVANVPVKLVDGAFINDKWAFHEVSAQTDASGIADLDAATTQPRRRADQRNIIVDRPGYDLAIAQQQQDSGGDLDVKLVLHKSSAHWKGQVVDSDGKPVAGAKVSVTSMQPAEDDPFSNYISLYGFGDAGDAPVAGLTTTADDEGIFELDRLPSGRTVGVAITGPGALRLDEFFVPQQDQPGTLKTFTVRRAASIKGRIVLKGLEGPLVLPEQGASVIVCSAGSEIPATVNKDGTFSRDGLQPGVCQVRVQMTDKALQRYLLAAPLEITAEEGKSVEAVAELEEGRPIRGKLMAVPEGSKATIVVSHAGTYDPAATAEVDKDGAWEAFVPADGEYTVRYIGTGMNQWQQGKSVTVKQGTPAELEISVEKSPNATVFP